MNVAVFGGGCFWCTEAVFSMLRGVKGVEPGYDGGTTEHPTYEQVTSGKTNHAEVIQITYDPAHISYTDLLTVFFATHDPTTLNQQGADTGTQYRSAIFCHDDDQQRSAVAKIDELNSAKIWNAPIVTQVAPLATFYSAEDYHQGYFAKHGLKPTCHIPKNTKK